MIKRLLLSLISLFSSVLVFSQPVTFEIKMDISNSDRVEGITELPNGDVVAVATTFANSNFDITIVKISPNGNLIASQTIGTGDNEFAKSVCYTSDGGFLISGYTYSSPSDNDALFIKVDSLFNLEFFKRLGNTPGNDYANYCIEANPGVYTFTGTIALNGNAKPALVNFDSNGNLLDEHYLNTNQFASPDYKGSYLGDGLYGFSHLVNAITLMDTTGTVVKDFAFSINGGFSTDVIKTNDNKFAAIGVGGVGAPQGSSVVFCKGDSTSVSFTLAKRMQVNGYDLQPVEIIQDIDNNYYICGNAFSLGSGYSDAFVLKLDSAGNLIWSNKYTPSTAVNCELQTMIMTIDGGILVAGNALTGGNTDMFFAKMDTSGLISCNTFGFSLNVTILSLNSATPHSPVSGSMNSIASGTVVSAASTPVANVLCISTGFEELVTDQIQVYPSLTDSYFTISTGNLIGNYQMVLYDISGKKVYHTEVADQSYISIQHFTAGVYFYKIYSGSNSILSSGKILKYSDH